MPIIDDDPDKGPQPFFVLGLPYPLKESILSLGTLTVPPPTICPRYLRRYFPKTHFLSLTTKSCLLQTTQYIPKITHMLIPTFTVDGYIIYIHTAHLVNWFKDPFHHLLENCRGVTQPKQHAFVHNNSPKQSLHSANTLCKSDSLHMSHHKDLGVCSAVSNSPESSATTQTADTDVDISTYTFVLFKWTSQVNELPTRLTIYVTPDTTFSTS